ncbi:MAG TPA: hypothetical protein DCR21_03330 [Succinivibrionaceae bacterium]|nr:hypothetical protein [Succinivibrionaceae bacterium]
MSADFLLVDNEPAVLELSSKIAALEACDFISLDTEFLRVVTYYPKLCLAQLCIDGTTYLADPVKTDIRKVIEALLFTKATVLVFSGSEDIEILADLAREYQLSRLSPENCIDIQTMCGFAEKSTAFSLRSCVKEFLEIELEKSETRSDWSQRPLTREQLEYSVLDVFYLKDLYDCLMQDISPVKLSWLKSEMQEILLRYSSRPSLDEAYLNIAGAGTLNEKELKRLKFLCSRRLEFAVGHDEALNRIITTSALCSIAREKPQNSHDLAECHMKWGAIRQYGTMVLDWVKQADRQPDEAVRLPYDYFSSKGEYKDAYRRLKHLVESCCVKAGISPELLKQKRLLNDYFYALHYGAAPKLLSSWRQEVIGAISFERLMSSGS